MVHDRLHNAWASRVVQTALKGLTAAGKGWACTTCPDRNLFRLTKSHKLHRLICEQMTHAIRTVYWASVRDYVEMVRRLLRTMPMV
jgi:hypothetical protein